MGRFEDAIRARHKTENYGRKMKFNARNGPWRFFKDFTVNQKVGVLTLNKSYIRFDEGEAVCKCTCDCGGEVYLSCKELLQRKKNRIGCRQAGCKFLGVGYMKDSGVYFLEVQLLRLLRYSPERVVPEWGGTAYPGVDPVSAYAGVTEALRCLKGLTKNKPKSSCYIVRHLEDLPYSATNCLLSTKPTPRLFVRFGATSKTVQELAKLYRLPVYKVSDIARKFEGPQVIAACADASASPPATPDVVHVGALESKPGYQHMDYNPFASMYNEASAGATLVLPVPMWVQATNLRGVLASRGLDEKQDFTVTLVKYHGKAKRPRSVLKRYAVEKLTPAELNII